MVGVCFFKKTQVLWFLEHQHLVILAICILTWCKPCHLTKVMHMNTLCSSELIWPLWIIIHDWSSVPRCSTDKRWTFSVKLPLQAEIIFSCAEWLNYEYSLNCLFGGNLVPLRIWQSFKSYSHRHSVWIGSK